MKLRKKGQLNSEKIWKLCKKSMLNSERYGRYWRNASWTVKNMKHMEEKSVEWWKDLENMEER